MSGSLFLATPVLAQWALKPVAVVGGFEAIRGLALTNADLAILLLPDLQQQKPTLSSF